MTRQFDLEQDIMGCWTMVDDLMVLVETGRLDTESAMALATIYQIKFEKTFSTFEAHMKEVYAELQEKKDEG